jgi:hypothetical protein
MDLLNVVIGLHAALGIDIPEADYRGSPRSMAVSST